MSTNESASIFPEDYNIQRPDFPLGFSFNAIIEMAEQMTIIIIFDQ
jgi:hypothetical protein